MRTLIVNSWNFIFDHEVSPLRHIPDIGVRHLILQVLGWMWATSFAVAAGAYAFLPASLIGHVALIAAVTITVATYTTATVKPQVFLRGAGRRPDGEHL
jgi:hypothetical protein